MRIYIVILLMLSACSSSGIPYSSKLVGHEKNSAQLIVYRPSSMAFSMRTPDIEINSKKTCGLPNGEFFIKTIDPSIQIISASFWDMPGTSQIKIDTKKDHTYYVRVMASSDKAVASGGIGLIGMLLDESVSDRSGPFYIDLVDEKTAQSELANLGMVSSCD
jgi:hypothetical protein